MIEWKVTLDPPAKDNDSVDCEFCEKRIYPMRPAWEVKSEVHVYFTCTKRCATALLFRLAQDNNA